MFSIIFGAALVIASGAFYWHLLPRDGKENSIVKNSDVGSMVTIAIMSSLIIGIGILGGSLFD
jgi:hypothetical protein